MNIDQMKKIIAKAKEEYGEQKFGVTYNGNGERIHAMDFEYNAAFHNTSDLRTIVNQHEEIENLKGHILVLQRRIEALRERQNVIKPENVEYYPYAMSDAEIVELSKLDKENDNE